MLWEPVFKLFSNKGFWIPFVVGIIVILLMKALFGRIEAEIKNVKNNNFSIINPGKCPKCSGGNLFEKNGRYGKFLGCNNYPKIAPRIY